MTLTYDADHRLTPDAVQEVSFPSARLGRRGFDEEHVRAFCGQVETELVMLLNERTALSEEVQRLRRRVLGIPGSEPGPGCRQEDAHIQAVQILVKAQQTADQYLSDAKQYSRRLAQDARRRRDDILAEARLHAAPVLTEAQGRASQAAQATMAAAAPQAGADDRRELEAEMAYLRTFSEVYRAHLRADLDALLRKVEEWDRAEKPSLAKVGGELPGSPAQP